MTPPVIVEIHIQKTNADCGIAAMATLLGLPYRKVSDKAIALFPRPHKSGLWTTELIALAKGLGVTLRRHKTPESDDTGLLVLTRPATGDGHCATLFQGVVLDPGNGLAYDFSTYLSSRQYAVRAFLK